ncbi:MAG TPA: hypothetical protein VLG09_05985 [Candidatus Saccharimonadales bacterium]|nr:hypothetical protein [Candidatus Saccharimonadales bacterium]
MSDNDRYEWKGDEDGREFCTLVIRLDRPCTDLYALLQYDNGAVPPVELSSDGHSVTYKVVPEMDTIEGDKLRNARDSGTGRIQLERGPLTKGKISLLTDLGYIVAV